MKTIEWIKGVQEMEELANRPCTLEEAHKIAYEMELCGKRPRAEQKGY